MQIFKKIMALALALTLTLSMGAVTAVAAVSNNSAPELSGDLYYWINVDPDKDSIKIPLTPGRRDYTVSLPAELSFTNIVLVRELKDDASLGYKWKDDTQATLQNPVATLTIVSKDDETLSTTYTVRFVVGGGGDNKAPELENLYYWIDAGLPTEAEEGPRVTLTPGIYDYTENLPIGASFSTIELLDRYGDDDSLGYKKIDRTQATPQKPVATMTIASSADETFFTTYTVRFVIGGGDSGNTDSGNTDSGNSGNTDSDNSANNPATTEKVKDTVDALKNPEKKLPADIAKTTTSGGNVISTIPVAMTSGSATVGMDMFNTLGNATASVGLKFTVNAGLTGGSMEVIVPGGFGKITEPGRIGYSMDYANMAENNDTMLKAVKGESVTSTTAKIGGNQTLPVEATITVATKVANGTTVNIYKYDPHTKKFITVGKAVAKDGKLTFGTKIMGEMLFTTGTI